MINTEDKQPQLTPATAFEIIYRATGTLQLNRADGQLLEASLRLIASLLPREPVQDQKEKTTIENPGV